MQTDIFSQSEDFFDLSDWEITKKLGLASKTGPIFKKGNSENPSDNDLEDQFVLLQLSEPGPNGTLIGTTEVIPALKGNTEKKDINLHLDFDSIKIASKESFQKDSKATLQLVIGQEDKLTGLDKLFYCINGGLSLYNDIKGRPTKSKEFEKSTVGAFGNKPISLPNGIGQINLKIVKHKNPIWWQKVFTYLKSDSAQELLSLTGFGGITERALDTIGSLLNSLFDEEPEILFKSIPIKVALSDYGKSELNGGLSTNIISCLNPGYWVMIRKKNYDKFVNANPIYFNGYGILAPNGMKEKDIMEENGGNYLNQMSYVVIKAKMKEVDLNQNII